MHLSLFLTRPSLLPSCCCLALLYCTSGLGDHPLVYDTFLRQSYAVVLEWALGIGEEGGQPLPPFKDFVAVNSSDVNL